MFDTPPESLLEFNALLSAGLFQPLRRSELKSRSSSRTHSGAIPLAWELMAPQQGPTLVILGGIHGNERCGILAIRYLLQQISSGALSLERGRLILAIGNEEAVRKNVRYVGENLNRQFKRDAAPLGSPYEKSRAEDLKLILSSGIDYLLDLHATTAPSAPYAMIERPRLARAVDFGFPIVVTGWGELGDPSVAGDTQTYADSFGSCGVTMENGQLSDPASVDSAIEASLRMLRVLGVRGAPPLPMHTSVVYELTTVQRYERLGFEYARQFSNLEPLKRGELIGTDSESSYFAPQDYEAVMILPGNISMIKPGDNLYQFGRRLSV